MNEAALDSSSKIMDLQTRMRQKEFKKRAVNRILWELAPGFKVGVKLFVP